MQLLGIRRDPFVLNVVLPVGISFYTFQTMSYVIDVYRGVTKAEHHFGKYAAFVSFFPQLVAGPIERPLQHRDAQTVDPQPAAERAVLDVFQFQRAARQLRASSR